MGDWRPLLHHHVLFMFQFGCPIVDEGWFLLGCKPPPLPLWKWPARLQPYPFNSNCGCKSLVMFQLLEVTDLTRKSENHLRLHYL